MVNHMANIPFPKSHTFSNKKNYIGVFAPKTDLAHHRNKCDLKNKTKIADHVY